MPWILNDANNPVFVDLGSAKMMDAKECYLTEGEAKAAQVQNCTHETRIGIRSTGRVFCADCSKPLN